MCKSLHFSLSGEVTLALGGEAWPLPCCCKPGCLHMGGGQFLVALYDLEWEGCCPHTCSGQHVDWINLQQCLTFVPPVDSFLPALRLGLSGKRLPHTDRLFPPADCHMPCMCTPVDTHAWLLAPLLETCPMSSCLLPSLGWWKE